VALLVSVPVVLVLGAGPASAHTELELSVPASGAVLQTAPSVVRLVFNEPLTPGLVSVVVSGPGGTNHAQGEPTVTGAVLVQRLEPLPVAGRYQVGYRVVSDDDHPVTGVIEFTVTSVAEPAVAVVSVPPPSLEPVEVAVAAGADAGRYAAPLLAGGTAVVVATGVVLTAVALARARRRTVRDQALADDGRG
jgi:methionine-rich copper-binding protein CopC